MNPIRLEPCELRGSTVFLRPMEESDIAALYEAAKFPEVWAFTLDNAGESIEAMRSYAGKALANRESGLEMPFVQICLATGEIIGSTRFHQTDPHSLEIGWTWIRPDHQRTRVNTESKYLMLCYAFEVLQAVRVQLKTDDRNLKSQNAIQRIGAKPEGVLRHDRTTWDGHRRSTHMFSILASEWPTVKADLESKLSIL